MAFAGGLVAAALEATDVNLNGLFTKDGKGSLRFGDQEKLLPLGL
jgi:hypothetical protein